MHTSKIPLLLISKVYYWIKSL